MSATFDLHLDEDATFSHDVLGRDEDGTEFVVFHIITAETTVNLFFGSGMPPRLEDEQVALRLSVAAAESWCDMDRVYRRQLARDGGTDDPLADKLQAVGS